MRIVFIALLLNLAGISTSRVAASSEVSTIEKMTELQASIKKSGAKVILFNVWGITCSPCMAEMPVLVRVYNQFKDNKNVMFLGVCIPDEKSDKKSAVNAAAVVVHKKQLEYLNSVWMGKTDGLIEQYPMQGTPYNALLNADGKVLLEMERFQKDPDKAVEYLTGEINKALKSL